MSAAPTETAKAAQAKISTATHEVFLVGGREREGVEPDRSEIERER